MSPHPTCSRCGMTLASAYIDGRHIDACPRSTCEGHQPTPEQIPGQLRLHRGRPGGRMTPSTCTTCGMTAALTGGTLVCCRRGCHTGQARRVSRSRPRPRQAAHSERRPSPVPRAPRSRQRTPQSPALAQPTLRPRRRHARTRCQVSREGRATRPQAPRPQCRRPATTAPCARPKAATQSSFTPARGHAKRATTTSATGEGSSRTRDLSARTPRPLSASPPHP